MTGTKHRNQRNEIPWPGPRPFTAREEAKFFGRESEQRHIVQRIDAGRITVISARSGVGKTSVLRAAVIPQLCRRRKPEPPGVRRRELPICVRDWWAGAPKTPEEAFRSAMLAGLQEMVTGESWRSQLPEDDLERLEAIASAGAASFADLVDAVCRAAGDVVLILDQFEEILRWSAGTTGTGPLDILEWLYSRPAAGTERLRLVLSMREEAEPALRTFERQIGGLSREVYPLGPITPDKARDVIVAPAKGTKWAVRDKKFVDALLAWLGRPGARPGDDEPDGGMLAHVWGEPFAGARLLGLQALLNELAHYAELEDGSLRGPMGCELLHQFLGSADEGSRVSDEEVEAAIGRAFSGTIDRAFTDWNPDTSKLPPEIAGAPVEPDTKAAIVRSLGRRLTALIAPELFNVAGFKIPRRHKELVERATAIDRRVLDPTAGMRTAAPAGASQQMERVSSVARQYNLGVDATLQFVTSVASQTLMRLAEHNLLKTFAGGGVEAMYELQHDGLGPWLNKWAATHRGSMEFSVASLSSLRGESFSWEILTGGRHSHLCWRGCEFEGKTFEDVTFEDGDFSGCYFTNCTFRGVRFRRCLLRGVVIRGGTVGEVEDEGSPGLEFRQVDARSLLIRELKVNGLFEIDRAVLEGMTVTDCTVGGEWRIGSSRVMLANFSALRGAGEGIPAIKVIDSDLVLSVFDLEALDTVRTTPVAFQPHRSLEHAFPWRHSEENLLAWMDAPVSIPIGANTIRQAGLVPEPTSA